MNKLRYWRLERGLSQHELAEASGIRRWAVQLIEAGHRIPSSDELEQLSLALGVEVKRLLPRRSNISRNAND